MINRYQGNSGRVVKIEDQGSPRVYSEKPRTAQPAQTAPPQPHGRNQSPPPPPQKPQSGLFGGGIQGIFSQLGKLLPGGAGKMDALETEDIILLLILYLKYRESGDSELLMMMGAMFLL